MRHPIILTLAASAIVGLSACEKSGERTVERALQDLNVVDETNLNDVMLTIGDPMRRSTISLAQMTTTRPD